jgi:hypothetical protein
MACTKCKATEYVKKPKFVGMMITSLIFLIFAILGLVTSVKFVIDLIS